MTVRRISFVLNTKGYRKPIAKDLKPKNGGDDRIRTCEGLLTLNDLANRRFQPLSHVSNALKKASFDSTREANFVKFQGITGSVNTGFRGLTGLQFANKIRELRVPAKLDTSRQCVLVE